MLIAYHEYVIGSWGSTLEPPPAREDLEMPSRLAPARTRLLKPSQMPGFPDNQCIRYMLRGSVENQWSPWFSLYHM
jgi:hypothetical protein